MTFVDSEVGVRVPATSANLGPGFDALGLALALHDELAARVIETGLDLQVHGEGAGQVRLDETHLVVQAMHTAFDAMDVARPGLAVRCENRIPHSRGMGSSAAAIVAGLLLARALVTDGDQRLSISDVLALAHRIEGHPDNVAPCLLGGLTVAWVEDGDARAVRRDVDPAVLPVVIVPPTTASTAVARALLPATLPHRDAALNAGRAALLVAALTGTPQALVAATEDRLHQDYRGGAMPQTARLVAHLRAEGLPAVVSGAGPTVLVLARGDVEAERAGELAVAFTAGSGSEAWTVHRLPVDPDGARITEF